MLRQQTQVINALRAHLAELGIVAAQGREGLKQLLTIIADEKDLPIDARLAVTKTAAPRIEWRAARLSGAKSLVDRLVERFGPSRE